jgi:predicted nuclease with TOPRIM domain
MKQSSENNANSYKNTFINVYFWIKSEVMDLEAMQHCINQRNKLIEFKDKISGKIRTNEERLNILMTGKASIRNMFKSKNSKDTEQGTLKIIVEKDRVEILDYQRIINIINQYIAEKALPFFKEDKMRNYYSMLDILCNQEVGNCNMDL